MTDRRNDDGNAAGALRGNRRGLLRGAVGSSVVLPLTAMAAGLGMARAAQAADSSGNFPEHKEWRFVFINHVTTNPFFVPTRYGAEDACAALGCTYQWTGSQQSIASEMVDAMNTAINAGVDGIAVALVDQHAFQAPVERALKAGIPVISYNADAKGNDRLAYVGQDLFLAGKALGQKITELIDEGEVVGFISTPGQLNIQPRLDGAKAAIKESGKNIKLSEVATGATINEEISRVEAYYIGHQSVKGMFAVDGGSTQGVASTMKKHGLHEKGVRAGGFDLLPGSLQGVKAGDLDFTIDQQPYLQGFYSVMELFVFKLSGGLSGPAEINTGLKFVTPENVGPYLDTETRFEGNSSQQKVVERKGAITAG